MQPHSSRLKVCYLAQFTRSLRRRVSSESFSAGRLAAVENFLFHLTRLLLLLQYKQLFML